MSTDYAVRRGVAAHGADLPERARHARQPHVSVRRVRQPCRRRWFARAIAAAGSRSAGDVRRGQPAAAVRQSSAHLRRQRQSRSRIPTPSGVTHFTWDARNRLINLTGPARPAPSPTTRWGAGRSKDINGRRTQFAYDGLDFIAETASTARRSRISGASSSTRRWSATGSKLRRRRTRQHGSADDPAGALATQYTYEPFGTTVMIGAPTDNPVQYTGRENDDTGLYHYRTRYFQSGAAPVHCRGSAAVRRRRSRLLFLCIQPPPRRDGSYRSDRLVFRPRGQRRRACGQKRTVRKPCTLRRGFGTNVLCDWSGGRGSWLCSR